MHEMSIAQSILEIVDSESRKAGVERVEELELEIGKLAGIEYETLEFSLKVLAPGTAIEGSRMVIDKPEGKAECQDCGHGFVTDSPVTICPECRSFSCNIVSGKQLRVKSILIE